LTGEEAVPTQAFCDLAGQITAESRITLWHFVVKVVQKPFTPLFCKGRALYKPRAMDFMYAGPIANTV
jgi:hypothetical protein